jgi:hypothetical protein
MSSFLEDARSTLQDDIETSLEGLAERRSRLVRRLAALVDREAELRDALSRARTGIPHGLCPDCWVQDGERSLLTHERDYRYDRVDDSYSCAACGNSYQDSASLEED